MVTPFFTAQVALESTLHQALKKADISARGSFFMQQLTTSTYKQQQRMQQKKRES